MPPAANYRTGLAPYLALLLGAAPLLCGCGAGGDRAVRVMRLEQMRPRAAARGGVYLNEPLVLHFSSDVDVSSVTRESLVVRPVGELEPAKGRIEVVGERVRFMPELGVARDLSDGGLLPGTRYEVLVRGFPAPDGLRSTSGFPLAHSARCFFTTAELSTPRRQMFDDTTPASGAPLTLRTTRLGGADSLVLECAEPLDPLTLVDGEFVLRSLERPADPGVPLDPRLVWNSQERGARLVLRPRRQLAPGRYALPQRADLSVRDFGGNAVWFPRLGGGHTIEVYEEGEALAHLSESFLDTQRLSAVPVPGVDGAAAWTGDGRLTVRYPAAAGSGADGRVTLRGAEGRKDLHAVRLEVPEAEEVELLSAPGLVVLRSQGRMVVDGRLVRRSGTGNAMNPGRGLELTAFLGRAAELTELGNEPNWTVMVAGGDLIVRGEVLVEGPLLLVAGGRIVVTGRVRAQASQLWLVGRGGGSGLDVTASAVDLVIDPPYFNPLVESLTFGVLSVPLPFAGGALRWGEAEVEADPGHGRFEVLYLPADIDVRAPLETWGAVRSPRDLLSAPSLRLLLLLTVEPADPQSRKPMPWLPPVIDDVRLEWEPGRR